MIQPLFAIVVPFRPKRNTLDWQAENQILSLTIKSVINQTYTNLKIYLVYTDKPDIGIEDYRLSLVPFPENYKSFDEIQEGPRYLSEFGSKELVERRWDKGRKLTFGAWLAKNDNADYVMAFDSDDRLSRFFFERLVADMKTRGNPIGWYVESGFCYRESSKYLISIPKNMRLINGSTHVLSSDLIETPDFSSSRWSEFNLFTDHGWIKDRIFQKTGQTMHAVHYPSVIYLVHQSNISRVGLWYSMSVKSVLKRMLRKVNLTPDLCEEFCIEVPQGQKHRTSSSFLDNLKALYQILYFIVHHPLARRKVFKYIKRFLYWQITQRLSKREQVWLLTSRSKVNFNLHSTGVTGNIYTGLQDFEEMGFLLHFLREDDLFVDVGANVGTYTILASAHVGARSMAFEPIPDTFNRLLRNIALNQIEGKVEAYNFALGATKSRLAFTNQFDTQNHVLMMPSPSGSFTSNVESFDALFDSERIPQLLKIDVEGFELAVLQGMSSLLSNKACKALIVELNGSGARYAYSDSDVHQLLVEADFKPFRYDPFNRKLEHRSSFGSTNTIYLRDYDFVVERLKSAPKVNVNGENF